MARAESEQVLSDSAGESHHRVYERAEIYDIAFDFRDYEAQGNFLLQCHEELRGRPAKSWLELAAGPARHTLEMARRGLSCTALDLSPAMVHYGLKLAVALGVLRSTSDSTSGRG